MVNKYSKKDVNTYNWLRAIPHYLTIYLALYPFYKLWFRIKISGRENMAKGETYLIGANHLSYFDPTIISLASLKPVAYMSKQELFKVPILKQFILMYGAFAVNREKLEISTIKTAKNILKKGWHVGMFPEGTRGNGKDITQVQKGLGYLAKSTKTKVLPLAIINSEKKHGPIIVKIGKPIDIIDKEPDQISQEWLEAIVELTGFEYKPKVKNKSIKEETDQALQEA
ncbi:MAG: lysophospholipid acyltransferase family protein [Vampirovibrionia bacterium]